MIFRPLFCPREHCPSHAGASFSYRGRGCFHRRCDHKTVQRFHCLACQRSFSEQTFRLNYRLKRPELLSLFFLDRVSKVSHRQSARIHPCSRSTEERHFRRLSLHCQAFHAQRLEEIAAAGGRGEVFSLDELETYEHDRRRKPLTVPILIEHASGFVIDTRVGTLPARGRSKQKPSPAVAQEGELRKSESVEVVQAAFERLREVGAKTRSLTVLTDMKSSYERILRELFGERCLHRRIHSRLPRNPMSPLFAINHTLARVRDGVSRLVRRTWCGAKLRRWLAGHLAIWTCYRNYVLKRTNRVWETPAMALGTQDKFWQVDELLRWRIFSWS